MNGPFRIVWALLLALVSTNLHAQEAADSPILGEERLREIALRWAAPPGLSHASMRDLNLIAAALDRKSTEAAGRMWRAYLDERGEGFNADASIDHVLNRLVAARSTAVNEARRKLRFYDAQENAIFEHVSTVDKLLSAYEGDDVAAVPLREPVLSTYGDEGEPVALAPGASVGKRELQASLHRWRERLPEITRAREAAIEAFVNAVIEDAALAAEIYNVDKMLRDSAQ